MALILAAVMAVSCATTILLAASKNWANPELGSLSQYYETGTNADPGAVSNVNGDPGRGFLRPVHVLQQCRNAGWLPLVVE